MITLSTICDKLNDLLSNENYNYKIYADGAFHSQPKRIGNNIEKIIEGIATIVNSSIVPVQGLKFGSQTISVELVIPINTKQAEETSIEEITQTYKTDINKLLEPTTLELDGYVATLLATIPEVGEIEQTSSIGLMIPITFNVEINYFLNGVNSLNEKLYYITPTYEEEEIHFTAMSLARTVIQDGGAFSNSNGVSKNYIQTTALAIELVAPALTDSEFCERFKRFLFDGNCASFGIRYKSGSTIRQYEMIFVTSNEQVQGTDNVGYTISMAEALE